MFNAALIFAVLFLLVGPIRLIVPYAKLVAGFDATFKWKIALVAAGIAAAICIFVALVGEGLLEKYDIAFESVRVAGGLLLTVSALKNLVFPEGSPAPSLERRSVFETGLTVATPVIVSPVGIAAILVFSMAASDAVASRETVLYPLLGLMAANLIVMLLIDFIMKIPGLKSVLYLIAAVLSLVQVALGVDAMMEGLGIIAS
ncbi:MAG: MarC family protein [Betaproteobacteria bacterium]|jgi:multiple antibiotic resistance protein|nr:MAG: MarC family protein [Betaproteobacteria bacterium]